MRIDFVCTGKTPKKLVVSTTDEFRASGLQHRTPTQCPILLADDVS